MTNLSSTGLRRPFQRLLAQALAGLALLAVSATAAEAANPLLRIEALGSLSGNGDVTAFVDQVEIVRVSDGMVMTGAVANPSFETNGPSAGQFSYNTAGAFWTFISNSGIARTGSGFGPTTPPQGDAVAFLQSFGGNNGRLDQILALADGVYRVQFRTTQRTNCCGGTLDQRLSVLVNGVSVGLIQPPAAASYATFTSSTFVVSNNALAFDGTDDRVSVPHNAVYNATAAITLESWVRTSVTGEKYITTKADNSWYLAMNGGGGLPGVA